MNIAGVLVHAHPEKLTMVRTALGKMPGVEVHLTGDDGRLVVTAEDTAEASAGDTILAMHRMEGVLSATLVYHNFDPDLSNEKPSGERERDHETVTAGLHQD